MLPSASTKSPSEARSSVPSSTALPPSWIMVLRTWHLQDFYWGTPASLHCVLLYRTKPLISCVPPSPLLLQKANAIIYKPCCYLSFSAWLRGSKQRIWLQPWYWSYAVLDVLGCHWTHHLRHEDGSIRRVCIHRTDHTTLFFSFDLKNRLEELD